MSATVADLLSAIKPLLRKDSDIIVCLKHPGFELQALTFVERRPARQWTEIDLYSVTLEDPIDVGRFYRELRFITRTPGGADFAVTLFHPGHGSNPLVEIATDGDNLILQTEISND